MASDADASKDTQIDVSKIPVIDLRLLCQDEICFVASLSAKDQDKFDMGFASAINKSIFNESVASRRQTYERHKAHRKHASSHSNATRNSVLPLAAEARKCVEMKELKEKHRENQDLINLLCRQMQKHAHIGTNVNSLAPQIASNSVSGAGKHKVARRRRLVMPAKKTRKKDGTKQRSTIEDAKVAVSTLNKQFEGEVVEKDKDDLEIRLRKQSGQTPEYHIHVSPVTQVPLSHREVLVDVKLTCGQAIEMISIPDAHIENAVASGTIPWNECLTDFTEAGRMKDRMETSTPVSSDYKLMLPKRLLDQSAGTLPSLEAYESAYRQLVDTNSLGWSAEGCFMCKQIGGCQTELVVCMWCEREFHWSCLKNGLLEIAGNWVCPYCKTTSRNHRY